MAPTVLMVASVKACCNYEPRLDPLVLHSNSDEGQPQGKGKETRSSDEDHFTSLRDN